jgi:hypothetical protein
MRMRSVCDRNHSHSYMSRDINRERDFHRFGFQFAGVKYRLVNEVRP